MTATPAVPRSAALYLGVVQFFFATTWTLYVIYLPQLVKQAGIDLAWVPWILVADQIIMALMDVVTGFWADRVRSGLATMGMWILGLSVISCAAFVALPFAGNSSTMLLLAILVWTLTSSALRAPPWALLSRYAAAPALPWMSTLVLSGTAIAAALAPYLGVTLRDIDPRVPFVLSTLTLLATVGGLIFVERHLARSSPTPAAAGDPPFDLAAPGAKRQVGTFFIALLLMAAAFQVHFSLNSAHQYLRFAQSGELQFLMPVFWIGFNLLMFPMAGFVKRHGPFRVMVVGAAAGSAASLATTLAPDLNTLIATQFIAGGCWGAVNVAAFTAAITFGRASREGAFLGMLFATLALAAFIRIGAYASDIAQQPGFDVILPWIPAGGWLLGAVLLWTARAAWQKKTEIA